MKSLIVDELKQLPVGDWVWIVCPLGAEGFYACKGSDSTDTHLSDSNEFIEFECDKTLGYAYEKYGEAWVAYKNKEQAECEGEFIHFPCVVGQDCYVVKNGVMKRMQLVSYKVVTGNFVEVYFANQKRYMMQGRPDLEAERGCSTLGRFNKDWFIDIDKAKNRFNGLGGKI